MLATKIIYTTVKSGNSYILLLLAWLISEMRKKAACITGRGGDHCEICAGRICSNYWSGLTDWFLSPPVGPGFYPPVMHQLSLPEDPEQWAVDPSYTMTHSAEAMVKVKGIVRGKKYNLMAQVIPIYGFGIFLYIFYIIYKVSSAW